MSITSLRISGNGLTAERARLDTIARNIANVETTKGPDGNPYRKQMVVFEATPADEGGVRVASTIESQAEFPIVHRPGHPDADAEGNVRMPNVNIVEEMVDLIAATRAYEANAGVATATKEMISRAIDLGRP